MQIEFEFEDFVARWLESRLVHGWWNPLEHCGLEVRCWIRGGLPFSVPRENVEVGNGHDVHTAGRAEREQIAVPRNQGIHGSDDRDGKDLIVMRIRADTANLNRRHHLGDRLELGSHRGSPIACPATGPREYSLKRAEDRGTDDQQLITTEDVLDEASRAPTRVERRNQRIGVEDNSHSAR